MSKVEALEKRKRRRAVQYLRMSTDGQKYSIENQASAIAAYAASRQIEIVRTYADPGRSGVRIKGRIGLQELIEQVQLGHADFDHILVYDVTRWGRFQDVDESAYYEFICKRSGISIHYCADEFENDGSLASVVLKNLKRVAAADYSKQLSKKVFLGQSHVTALGYWRGGPAPYGLRRMVTDEVGKRKAILELGESKNLKSERVLLVPGPRNERETIRRIFKAFVLGKKSRMDIAAELNTAGILNARSRLWSSLTISNILKNEAYIGHLVFNRRSQKLGGRQVHNPPEMWVRHDNAFKPIVPVALFRKAQKRLTDLDHGRSMSDADLIDRLRMLFRKNGRLSLKLMMTSKGIPAARTYTKRFGSLAIAFRKAGFEPKPHHCFQETAKTFDRIIRGLAVKVMKELENRGTSVSFLDELNLLTIGRSTTVSIALAKPTGNGRGADGQLHRYELRRVKYKKADFILIVRIHSARIKDYFLLSMASLPETTDGRTRISDRRFGPFRYEGTADVVSALLRRTRL